MWKKRGNVYTEVINPHAMIEGLLAQLSSRVVGCCFGFWCFYQANALHSLRCGLLDPVAVLQNHGGVSGDGGPAILLDWVTHLMMMIGNDIGSLESCGQGAQ